MKILRRLFLLPVALVTVGCSTLDTSSEYSDAVKSIKERSNYVEVYAKSIIPDTKALIGADLVKSELTYVSVHNKGAKPLSKHSNIDMAVTYFKNYDSFSAVELKGKVIAIENFRPIAETCTEHCTVTQWFRFPFNEQTLNQFDGGDVTFTISSGKKNTVEVSIPKAYFEAIEQEGRATIEGRSTNIGYESSTSLASINSANESKSIEMVHYWYEKASPQEKELFAQFAVKNRKSILSLEPSDSQTYNMLQYWYSEASAEERSNILLWIINQ